MNRHSLFRNRYAMNVGRWYRIENKATNVATVYIFDEIGEFGVSASQFVDELNAIKAPKIELRLNTPGGSVMDGLAMFNAIKDHPAHVTAIVDGWACSAGSYILQAGDHRVMNSFSQLMIHDAALAITMGNAKDHRETADFLDKSSDNIAAIYASRTPNITAAEWRAKMEQETWYTAEEAVDAGLADEWIVSTQPAEDVANAAATNKVPVIPVATHPKVEPEPANPWAGFDFFAALSGANSRKVSA